jgi:hypothetical protein
MFSMSDCSDYALKTGMTGDSGSGLICFSGSNFGFATA